MPLRTSSIARSAAAIALPLLLASPAVAQDGGPPESAGGPPPAEPGFTFSLEGQAILDFDRDLDGGGSMEVTRLAFSPKIDWTMNDATSVSLGLGIRYDDYEFDGTSVFGATAPWDDVNGVDIDVMVRHRINDSWTFFGGPSVSFDAEDGADLADGATVSGLAAAIYAVNRDLLIGPAVIVSSQIEDGVQVIPIPYVRWQIREDLRLSTEGDIHGPGVALTWDLRDDLDLSVGIGWANRRFRLDDVGIAPDGVGEVEALRLGAALVWEPAANTRVVFIAGANLEGEVRLEDDRGFEIAETDSDPGAFIALRGTIEF